MCGYTFCPRNILLCNQHPLDPSFLWPPTTELEDYQSLCTEPTVHLENSATLEKPQELVPFLVAVTDTCPKAIKEGRVCLTVWGNMFCHGRKGMGQEQEARSPHCWCGRSFCQFIAFIGSSFILGNLSKRIYSRIKIPSHQSPLLLYTQQSKMETSHQLINR